MKLKNKIALITGASKGIGKAVAEGFAEEGAQLYLVGHKDQNGLNEVIERCKSKGAKADGGLFDVGHYSEVERLMEEVGKVFGSVDILVNNAGIIKPTPLLEISPQQWDEVVKTHLYGTFYCTTETVRRFMKDKRRGKIINLCAPAALRGFIGVADYNIQVNAIRPVAKTRMIDALAEFYGPEGEHPVYLSDPSDPTVLVPSFVFFASEDSDYVTAQILTADGGMTC